MAAMLWRHVVIKTDNDPGLMSNDLYPRVVVECCKSNLAIVKKKKSNWIKEV